MTGGSQHATPGVVNGSESHPILPTPSVGSAPPLYPASTRPYRPGHGLLGAVAAPVRVIVGGYRSSLAFRVVSGTFALSTVIVLIVGWLLMHQVTTGLLDTRLRSVEAEAAAGARNAQVSMDSADTSTNTAQLLTQLTSEIGSRGAAGGGYGVVLEPAAPGQASETVGKRTAGAFTPQSVPDDLRAAVEQGRVAYRYAPLMPFEGGRVIPGIVTGTQVVAQANGMAVDLFFLFPLDQEQNTLRLVQRSLLLGGTLVVGLLAGVAWLVTRQVVAPVRMAREVSERLAAGRLEERMRVRGRDDLARLGTSINHMASNLQRQIGQLEDLTGVQRRFVSDVSHELRTPLTTVRMAADVLYDARAQFDPGTARAAELMNTELDRFEALLADLLEISRFDAGAAALEIDEIDLRDVTRRVLDSIRGLASRRGVEVRLSVPADRCLVEVDGRRIERVLRNLVSNAIEYGDGSDVDVGVRADDNAAAVTVRDHGIGLAPGESVLVFNRFWRADPARAKTRGGTGLGLAIAHEDAHLHGGWLQAWGEPGRGSNFRLTLPRRQGETLTHSPLQLVPADIVLEQVRRVGAAYQQFEEPER